MLEKGEENFEGVFVWAPSLRYWLKDPNYIFWLGTVQCGETEDRHRLKGREEVRQIKKSEEE